MSEYDKDDFFDDEQPVLTPEEIELIKQRRRQKAEERKSDKFDYEFFDGFNSAKKDKTEKKPFRVNIPAESIVDDYSDEPFIRSGYSEPSHRSDVPVSRVYSESEERYDYNTYRAEQEPEEDDDTENEPRRPKKRGRVKKARNGGCFSAFISVFLILAIIIGGCGGYIFFLSCKVQPAELKDNYSSELLRNSDIENILLIGLDKESGGVSRSDSMILLSIDNQNKTLKLTSFLRDLWVNIPGYYNSKLNASYAFGGPQLTVDTIESNFKIDIDHVVLVDFEMFEKIIDSLGGVTVDITENEAAFLRNNTRVKVPAGENTLNGEWALIYARIRKLDSDFYRTQRQRKVISSIIEKAKKSNPITLVKMVSDIMPLITTDIGPAEMTQLAFSALKYIHYDIDQLQVPADDAYSSQMISGQAALVPDMDKNIRNIQKFIYGLGD